MVAVSKPALGYNQYFLPEEDLKYLPPYLRDVRETPNEIECKTTGAWPSWLHGTFIRVGPGRFTVPLSEDGSKPNAVIQHFFDGLGMLHKFRMLDGSVYYTSRYTSEGVVKRAKKDGYLSTNVFGLNPNTPLKHVQDPCWALLGAQQSLYHHDGHLGPDDISVNVAPRRGFHLPPDSNPLSKGLAANNPEAEEVLVQADSNLLQVCDARTLEPKRMLTYAQIDPELSGYGICSHPPKDRKRGLTFNYLIDPEKGIMSVFALNIVAKPTSLLWKTPLPCKPCYIHSLAMTDKYVVFIRNPVQMDVSDTSKPMVDMLQFEPNTPTQFFVLNKIDGKHVATYSQKDGFMFFHSVNGYDYVDPRTGAINIHVDLCSYESTYVPYSDYSLSNIVDPAGPLQNATLIRYELAAVDQADADHVCRATVAAFIPGMACELPRIAKSASMVPGYRYVYCASGTGGPSPGTAVPIGRLGNGLKVVQAALFGSLAKSDWKTGTFKRWQPKNGESCPCEPVFVQRPGATKEDDGVVLTIVIDREGMHSILIALDGTTFEEIARADMPQVYGLGPHGSFVEGDFGI
ncbi:retinal pigment epithelial membrane family protein [Colletotrichum truncatum]|uniref:Retinal pigment epithelial membrane family protein n=1 Tax=Colletotrichum truncatum TaxID=5467 RepID=A0ACC3YP08_COLTU|nr:retinal pigment epithelial membrane family protein [Colletotrichum truncatum]KAF6782788.1 retinal pigment epithelial membrane family protein [Colletotrichum truncatum]